MNFSSQENNMKEPVRPSFEKIKVLILESEESKTNLKYPSFEFTIRHASFLSELLPTSLPNTRQLSIVPYSYLNDGYISSSTSKQLIVKVCFGDNSGLELEKWRYGRCVFDH